MLSHLVYIDMVLVSKFKQLFGSAYNYKEALARENLQQENVEALREKIKSVQLIPKRIFDHQVSLLLNTFHDFISYLRDIAFIFSKCSW